MEDNRAKIVETALDMFNSRGCRGVTMDDIAQAMHMSKRTLYEMFTNKEVLLGECMALIRERTMEMHRQAHSRAGEPLLVAMYMLRTNALFIHKYRRLIEETERYYPEVHSRFFALHSNDLRCKVQLGMDYVRSHGYLRVDADVEVAVDFLCSITHHMPQVDVASRDEYARRVGEMCFTYLRGLMTLDTISRYELEEEHFREVTTELNAIYNSQDI